MRVRNDRVSRRNHNRSFPFLLRDFNANYTAQGALLSMRESEIPAKKGFDRKEKCGIIGASEKKGAIFHEL